MIVKPCEEASTLVTHSEALRILRHRIASYPTMRASAQALGVTSPYLGDVLKGRRDIGPTLAKSLGLEPVRYFRCTAAPPGE